jgi:hypothetical protein
VLCRSLQTRKGTLAMKSAITGKDPLMGFRASPAMRASVVRWAERQSGEPSLSEALRRLVELGLTVKPPARSVSKAGRRLRAQELATKAIEKIIDPSAPTEERAQRRRRLLKGPEEFARPVSTGRRQKPNDQAEANGRGTG